MQDTSNNNHQSRLGRAWTETNPKNSALGASLAGGRGPALYGQ